MGHNETSENSKLRRRRCVCGLFVEALAATLDLKVPISYDTSLLHDIASKRYRCTRGIILLDRLDMIVVAAGEHMRQRTACDRIIAPRIRRDKWTSTRPCFHIRNEPYMSDLYTAIYEEIHGPERDTNAQLL